MENEKIKITVTIRDLDIIRKTLVESGYPVMLSDGVLRVFDLFNDEESNEFNNLLISEIKSLPVDISDDEFRSLLLGR